MKKMLALVMGVLMIVGFSACATTPIAPATTAPVAATQAPTVAPTVEPTPAEPVTLKVWESDGPEKEFILWAGTEFTKLHPNITVTYEAVAHVDARAKIELDGPAGVGPDVFCAPHDHLGALVTGGHVLVNPEPEYINANFVEAAVKAVTYDSKIYGYPIAVETYGLFYNKALIKEAPKSWDDVIAFAKTFNDAKNKKYGIVWETGNAYYDYLFLSGYGADLFGPNGTDQTKHMVNSPEAIQGLTYFQKLRKDILDVSAMDMTGDFCNAAFTGGNAAMFISGPWSITACKTAGLDFGVAPLPALPGQATSPASFSGIRTYFISAYSTHPVESQEFLDFVTSKEALQKRFELTSQIPARKDLTVSDPMSQGILAQFAFSKPMPSIPAMGTYWSAMGAAYANIWNGNDIKTELDAAAAAIEAAK